ncbi:SGNH/GDSL hydrolase family protein [Calothrix sp. CCY 0018]|uniref:SGNH/GDSL hydrolase family protein n=1 Tax=Calothrix sp. CCY 0018 TaxID=3103864 RepID=UPI0039C5D9CC
MPHIVLLGDSIFDNATYVGEDPDVITQLRMKVPENWNASLKAIDGNKVDDVYAQLEQLPKDTTHLVLSIGGNDALCCIGILNEKVASSAEVFIKLANLREDFEQQYQKLLQSILSLKLPTALCTIYNPNYPESTYQRIGVTALTIFNDVIIRQAFQNGIPLIDLRLTCNEATDYANPIEPSCAGGEKIVNAIVNAVLEHNFSKRYTQVFY